MNDTSTTNPVATAAAANVAHSGHSSNLLWASAFVLLGLIVVQVQGFAQPLGGSSAHAGMVAQSGPLTALTADAGSEDLLLVLEGRTEELMVYRTDRNGTLLHQRLAVPKLFEDARSMAQGK